MKWELARKMRWMLWVVLPALFLSLGIGAVESLGQTRARDIRQGSAVTQQEQVDRVGLPPLTDSRMADLSLMMREQVDFLLTPALLVQEAISDDIVLTYPEE